MIKKLMAFLKLFLFLVILISYFFVATIIYFTRSHPVTKRSALVRNTQFFSRLLALLFRVKVVCRNPVDLAEQSLVVGNHMGFVDVMALQSVLPCVFVTSIEMKRAPVLGQISQLAGCAYVNRQSRANINDELTDLVHVLNSGLRIGLYPEAQATNGEQVLPFKKTLLMAAGLAGKPIRPYVFNFTRVNGRPVEFRDRDYLCWYGEQTFFDSVWRTWQLYSVECEIEFLPLIYPKESDDRTVVSEMVHDVIAARFRPFVPTADRNLPPTDPAH